MATSTDSWILDRQDYGPTPTPQDLYEFFGIPPDPEDTLEANIREKRKVWRGHLNRTRADEGRRISEAVLQAISEAEDALLRGATVEGGGPVPEFRAAGSTKSIDDIFNEIERLLFRGRHEEALGRLEASEPDWGSLPRFKDLRARVILDVFEQAPALLRGHDVVNSAIADLRIAIDELGADEGRYVMLIDLLDASGDTRAADQAYRIGLEQITDPSPSYRTRELTILSRSQDVTALVKKVVELIKAARNDRGLRSSIVQIMLHRAAKMLPLDTETGAMNYAKVIDAAAWAAQGVPEAENTVRPHRMWAAAARQKVFSGNWQWRALLAVLSGFIALPVLNIAMSRAAYEILLRGPADASSKLSMAVRAQNRAYFVVTRNGFVESVHANIKLPWQTEAGQFQELSNVDALFDFAG